MADPKEEKKSIFDKAVDMVSGRDEKAAIDKVTTELNALKTQMGQEQAKRIMAEQKTREAEQRATMAEQKLADAQKELQTVKQTLATTQQTASSAGSSLQARITAAETRATAAEARVKQLEEQVAKYQADQAARATATQVTKTARKHKVVPGDTLSGIALKYYGSAAREKWMIIYEANKATIGDNPNIIRAGTELIIP